MVNAAPPESTPASTAKVCYSRFNGARNECTACELSTYCREAKDPPQMGHRDIDAVAEPAAPDQVDEDDVVDYGDLPEALIQLLDAVAANPQSWQLTRMKIVGGGRVTLQSLAEESGLGSKQAIQYHLAKLARMSPAIRSALPGCKGRMYSERPEWLRTSA